MSSWNVSSPRQLPLALYQRYVSPEYNAGKEGGCHYTPSCSQYAKEAVELHGVVEGGKMAFFRLMRCYPDVAAQGSDPVPGCEHHHDAQPLPSGERTPAFRPRTDSSLPVKLAAGAARLVGALVGGLLVGTVGVVTGAAVGGYLGAVAGQGPDRVKKMHDEVAARYSEDSLKGLARLERPTQAVARAVYRGLHERVGEGAARVVATVVGTLAGGLVGALGGLVKLGLSGGKMGGLLLKNLTREALEGEAPPPTAAPAAVSVVPMERVSGIPTDTPAGRQA